MNNFGSECFSILPPILNRFGQMRLADVVLASQTSDSPRHLEDAAVAACRESQTVEGMKRYSVNIRYQRDYRNDLQACRC